MARPSTGYQEFGFVKYYTTLRVVLLKPSFAAFRKFLG